MAEAPEIDAAAPRRGSSGDELAPRRRRC